MRVIVMMVVMMRMIVRMIVRPALLLLVHISNRQFAIQHAALNLNDLLQFSQLSQQPANGDNFQALVTVQVDVHIRNNVPVEPVLNIHQQQRELSYFMIVNHHDCPRDHLFGQETPRLQQSFADKVADRFGAVRIVAPLDQPIEIAKEMLVE